MECPHPASGCLRLSSGFAPDSNYCIPKKEQVMTQVFGQHAKILGDCAGLLASVANASCSRYSQTEIVDRSFCLFLYAFKRYKCARVYAYILLFPIKNLLYFSVITLLQRQSMIQNQQRIYKNKMQFLKYKLHLNTLIKLYISRKKENPIFPNRMHL